MSGRDEEGPENSPDQSDRADYVIDRRGLLSVTACGMFFTGVASQSATALDQTANAQSTSGGEEIWSFEAGYMIASSPTVVDGTVYIGTTNVYAVDADTGEEVWSSEVDVPYTPPDRYSSPTVVGGRLYGAVYDTVYALNADSGAEVWSFQVDYITSSPTVVDGTVFVNSEGTYALDADSGEEMWSSETGGRESSPTVVDGTVYLTSKDSNVYALDADDGEEVWSFRAGTNLNSSPTVVDGTVYIGGGRDDGSVYALDAASGEQVWSFETGDWVTSSPTVADDTVYVGSHGNNLYALDADTGEEVWADTFGDNVISSPTVADGIVYIGCIDSNVYALDAASGEEVWSFETGYGVRSSPTVVDGVLYIGSGDTNLYALDAGVEGSSEGSRVNLGTLGHHHVFAEQGSPTPSVVYWQVDFSEGEEPPMPPSYWPNDLMAGLGNSDDGVTESPSFRRQSSDGQLGDVNIVDNEFKFDDEGNPTEATVKFEVEEGAEARDLHLAAFTLPGPFDEDEIDEQELFEATNGTYAGGETGELTVPISQEDDD